MTGINGGVYGTTSADILAKIAGGTIPGSLTAAGLVSTATLQAGATSGIQWGTSRSVMLSPADGIITLTNAANTGFTRANFGGTTSSFPALARNSAALEVKLADNSAYASLYTNSISILPGTALSAGGNTAMRLEFSSTSTFGVYAGSGAPTISAAKGSLYLRSDGSTTNDRLYVNTNGSTGWTPITTAT